MANERTYKVGSTSSDYWFKTSSGVSAAGSATAGKSSVTGHRDGAIRFGSVVSQNTINHATLELKIAEISNNNSSKHLRISVYGIKENNTASFSSDPLGRTQTSAHADIDVTMNNFSNGQWYGIDVTSVLNEVLGQVGRNSGDAVGFFLRDNSSDDDAFIDISPTSFASPSPLTTLTIKENSDPNFTPTPITVSAPTLPSHKGWGMAWAYPGINVFDATEQQRYYDSWKRTHKILAEDVINATANVTYLIPHGLTYRPFAQAYVKSTGGTGRFKIPRYFPSIQGDPFSDNINGTVEVDNTYVRITVNANAEVYYRIFLDQLAT